MVDEKIELHKVAVRVHSDIRTVMHHFRRFDHLKGSSYSNGAIAGGRSAAAC